MKERSTLMNPWRPRIVSARVLAEGGQLPRGYGVAWVLPFSHTFYCLPVPFNRLVGAFRAWYLVWRQPVEDDPLMAAHRLGFEEGRRVGEERMQRHYEAMLRDEIRAIRAIYR